MSWLTFIPWDKTECSTRNGWIEISPKLYCLWSYSCKLNDFSKKGFVSDKDDDNLFQQLENEAEERPEVDAKTAVAENKKLFAELLGGDKARSQDIGDMLLRFAAAPGSTTQ